MSLIDLENGLNGLTLADPECLPFGPPENIGGLIDDIPRYLFRVFTPRSRGATDTSWTKSMDARDGATTSRVDIFARADEQQVAEMIHRHLRWEKGPEDNLVSWTSSLLFALVYIFHLHANSTDGSTFDEICLCIIDTTSFPTGVFLRDMDLIRYYDRFDIKLQRFKGLRLQQHPQLSGYYYFGEYVSQGSLRIEGKCQIVSAQGMIDRGLYDLRPEFEAYANWEPQLKPPWANKTIELRECFYQGIRQGISEEGKQAAINIAQLFDQRWKLPVAVNLISLVPHRSDDTDILIPFRGDLFTDDDRRDCSPERTKVVAYDTLPEVQECALIMQSLYNDYCLRKLTASIGEAEASLRNTLMFTLNENLGAEGSALANQDLVLPDVSYEAALQKLKTISSLTQYLHRKLGGKQREGNRSMPARSGYAPGV